MIIPLHGTVGKASCEFCSQDYPIDEFRKVSVLGAHTLNLSHNSQDHVYIYTSHHHFLSFVFVSISVFCFLFSLFVSYILISVHFYININYIVCTTNQCSVIQEVSSKIKNIYDPNVSDTFPYNLMLLSFSFAPDTYNVVSYVSSQLYVQFTTINVHTNYLLF